MNIFEQIELKLYLLLLSCIIFTNALTDITISSESVTESQLGYLSILSNSLLHIINYEGYDINLSIVSQPVLLLRYFAVGKYIIPVQYLESLDNKTVIESETFRNSLDYIGILFEKSRVTLARNLDREVIVYLHPPNQDTSPELYQDVYWATHDVLKDPFRYEVERNDWKDNLLITTPKLSLLICKPGRRRSSCKTERNREAWINSVIGNNRATRFIEMIQILEMSESGEHLSMLCPYCNPCNSMEMVQITRPDMLTLNSLFHHNKLLETKSKLASTRVVLYFAGLELYGEENKKGAQGRKALLKHIAKLDLKLYGHYLPHSIDIHATKLLFPENLTLHHSASYEHDQYEIKRTFVAGCPKPVKSLGRLRPFLARSTDEHLAMYPELGLVFQRTQFHFVSCHLETSHWITKLGELIFAFDTATWLLIILSALLFVRTLACISPTRHHKSKNKHLQWDAGYDFAASLVDQSTKIFERPKKGRILLYWLPLMLLVLSNEYKGENITNLTVPPALVPFDTFDLLVENKFDIRSRRSLLSDDSYFYLNYYGLYGETHSDFVQISPHEAFPIISEIWHEILVKFPYREYKRLAALQHKISKRTNFYLNHSQMLSEWKSEGGRQGIFESIEEILSLHMNKCEKSAMILHKAMAQQLYNVLKTYNKPTFYGKDTLNENLFGYVYRGYFPANILRRIKFSFSSGIIEWWQKYLNWFLIMKTKYDNQQNQMVKATENGSQSGNSRSAALILSLIPSFGFLLAITIFICHDCQTIRAFFKCFGTILKALPRIQMISLKMFFRKSR